MREARLEDAVLEYLKKNPARFSDLQEHFKVKKGSLAFVLNHLCAIGKIKYVEEGPLKGVYYLADDWRVNVANAVLGMEQEQEDAQFVVLSNITFQNKEIKTDPDYLREIVQQYKRFAEKHEDLADAFVWDWLPTFDDISKAYLGFLIETFSSLTEQQIRKIVVYCRMRSYHESFDTLMSLLNEKILENYHKREKQVFDFFIDALSYGFHIESWLPPRLDEANKKYPRYFEKPYIIPYRINLWNWLVYLKGEVGDRNDPQNFDRNFDLFQKAAERLKSYLLNDKDIYEVLKRVANAKILILEQIGVFAPSESELFIREEIEAFKAMLYNAAKQVEEDKEEDIYYYVPRYLENPCFQLASTEEIAKAMLRYLKGKRTNPVFVPKEGHAIILLSFNKDGQLIGRNEDAKIYEDLDLPFLYENYEPAKNEAFWKDILKPIQAFKSALRKKGLLKREKFRVVVLTESGKEKEVEKEYTIVK